MLRTTQRSMIRATAPRLGGGYAWNPDNRRYKDKEFPNMPHRASEGNVAFDSAYKNTPGLNRLKDTISSMNEESAMSLLRSQYHEPVKYWHKMCQDEMLLMSEHDREEFNNKPYVTVNHLYEPPTGSEARPVRVEAGGVPGDNFLISCLGNCAPHVPNTTFHFTMKGYTKNQCPFCEQYFYVHNRPQLMMHPDWTDDPAADEGPAYTFAEVETEFDRDFHEYRVYMGLE
jgi:hypothetical protein